LLLIADDAEFAPRGWNSLTVEREEMRECDTELLEEEV
jgi:hypothetical protein